MYLNKSGPIFGDGVDPDVDRVGVGGAEGDVHLT